MTEQVVFSGPTYGPPVPIACRACGAHLIYPRPCPQCGEASTWYDVATVPEPPLGTECWHVREGDPYGVERWWDGTTWTPQIRGGEKMRWLDHLQGLPDDLRTPYTADQIAILTYEVELIAWAIDPLGPPEFRKRSVLSRLFHRH